jgi:hypothetical protein
MKKWIPNEMLTDEPQQGEEANSFQKIIFGLGDEGIIEDPVTKEELEITSDVATLDDGSYVMRFSVEAERETYRDQFEDKFYVEKSYNVDVPLDVIGDPSDTNNSQILFDVDKDIDVYESTKTYSATYLHEKKDKLISEEKDAIPDALDQDFKKFADNLDKSIREVGFDVFETNIVQEVEKDKKKHNKDGPSPSM